MSSDDDLSGWSSNEETAGHDPREDIFGQSPPLEDEDPAPVCRNAFERMTQIDFESMRHWCDRVAGAKVVSKRLAQLGQAVRPISMLFVCAGTAAELMSALARLRNRLAYSRSCRLSPEGSRMGPDLSGAT
jgi:hypothetical protein